ncbi:hypothetical protein [Kitasatospora sp. NBC_00315]|uniref:hypothetical protein n=1 Tax=Kitasatospora sp. NBC_00315 TaxID=2975963 RepID=UPI00324CBF50
MSARTEKYRPRRGETVRDHQHLRNGVYMDTRGGQVYLRPEGGGVEWTVRPEHIGPVAGGHPAESGGAR